MPAVYTKAQDKKKEKKELIDFFRLFIIFFIYSQFPRLLNGSIKIQKTIVIKIRWLAEFQKMKQIGPMEHDPVSQAILISQVSWGQMRSMLMHQLPVRQPLQHQRQHLQQLQQQRSKLVICSSPQNTIVDIIWEIRRIFFILNLYNSVYYNYHYYYFYNNDFFHDDNVFYYNHNNYDIVKRSTYGKVKRLFFQDS